MKFNTITIRDKSGSIIRRRYFKKSSITNSLFELRIGPLVLAWASDADVILMLKADYIFNRVVRYPEMLEIYMDGFPWLFDEKLSYKKASRLIAAHSVGKYIFV